MNKPENPEILYQFTAIHFHYEKCPKMGEKQSVGPKTDPYFIFGGTTILEHSPAGLKAQKVENHWGWWPASIKNNLNLISIDSIKRAL